MTEKWGKIQGKLTNVFLRAFEYFNYKQIFTVSFRKKNFLLNWTIVNVAVCNKSIIEALFSVARVTRSLQLTNKQAFSNFKFTGFQLLFYRSEKVKLDDCGLFVIPANRGFCFLWRELREFYS